MGDTAAGQEHMPCDSLASLDVFARRTKQMLFRLLHRAPNAILIAPMSSSYLLCQV